MLSLGCPKSFPSHPTSTYFISRSSYTISGLCHIILCHPTSSPGHPQLSAHNQHVVPVVPVIPSSSPAHRSSGNDISSPDAWMIIGTTCHLTGGSEMSFPDAGMVSGMTCHPRNRDDMSTYRWKWQQLCIKPSGFLVVSMSNRREFATNQSDVLQLHSLNLQICETGNCILFL